MIRDELNRIASEVYSIPLGEDAVFAVSGTDFLFYPSCRHSFCLVYD